MQEGEKKTSALQQTEAGTVSSTSVSHYNTGTQC